MITFQNKNEFVRYEINWEEDTVSTLLIPEFLYDDFLSKTKKHKGNTALYLQSLLRRFRSITHSGLIPEAEKLKTSYQERNLGLKKVSFIPKNRPPICLVANPTPSHGWSLENSLSFSVNLGVGCLSIS